MVVMDEYSCFPEVEIVASSSAGSGDTEIGAYIRPCDKIYKPGACKRFNCGRGDSSLISTAFLVLTLKVPLDGANFRVKFRLNCTTDTTSLEESHRYNWLVKET